MSSRRCIRNFSFFSLQVSVIASLAIVILANTTLALDVFLRAIYNTSEMVPPALATSPFFALRTLPRSSPTSLVANVNTPSTFPWTLPFLVQQNFRSCLEQRFMVLFTNLVSANGTFQVPVIIIIQRSTYGFIARNFVRDLTRRWSRTSRFQNIVLRMEKWNVEEALFFLWNVCSAEFANLEDVTRLKNAPNVQYYRDIATANAKFEAIQNM